MKKKGSCRACVMIQAGVKFRKCPKHTCELKDVVSSSIKIQDPYKKEMRLRIGRF